MTKRNTLTRRAFLTRTGALGCSMAASPLVTPIALAAAPGEHRLVVIILRGAMDGLDVVRPVGAPEYAALRPGLFAAGGRDETLPLTDFFGLHPALAGLHPLWRAGELGFAHAVSTPYRDKRSHFDGQDILETGAADIGAARDGWLNRALGLMPGSSLRTAFAVGREEMLVLAGQNEVSQWAPDMAFALTAQSQLLLARMYRDAPLFRASLDEAITLAGSLDSGAAPNDYGEALDAMMQSVKSAGRGGGLEKVAAFAAEQLLGETRIASFSINGWDTHAGQTRALPRALRDLETAILTLKSGLGGVWGNTLVLAMTEFGRTARENGTGGTDHGTGGAMVMAGGALKGGQVHGDWPGLDELDLYQARDLQPTADVRSYAGAALAGLFGLRRSDLEARVFPGLDLGAMPGILA